MWVVECEAALTKGCVIKRFRSLFKKPDNQAEGQGKLKKLSQDAAARAQVRVGVCHEHQCASRRHKGNENLQGPFPRHQGRNAT